MTPEELSLVPLKDLIEELKRRTDTLVIGYTFTADPGKPFVDWDFDSKSSWMDAVALCEDIKIEVLLERRKLREGIE